MPNTKRLQAMVNEDLHAKVVAAAADDNRTVSEYLRLMIEERFA